MEGVARLQGAGGSALSSPVWRGWSNSTLNVIRSPIHPERVRARWAGGPLLTLSGHQRRGHRAQRVRTVTGAAPSGSAIGRWARRDQPIEANARAGAAQCLYPATCRELRSRARAISHFKFSTGWAGVFEFRISKLVDGGCSLPTTPVSSCKISPSSQSDFVAPERSPLP